MMRRNLALLAVPMLIGASPYKLPPEAPPAPPAGPDVELVQAHCAACHSIDYVTSQPRGKGDPFWRDTVNKMINVYGAPIDKDQADRIAAYLGRTYGAAR